MPGAPISEPFEVIGTLTLSEGGLTTRCSYGYVMRVNADMACEVGADGIQYVTIDAPSAMSTCFRTKANFIRFKK